MPDLCITEAVLLLTASYDLPLCYGCICFQRPTPSAFVTSYWGVSFPRCHGVLYCNTISIRTLVANLLIFVKCIDCCIHSLLSLLVAVSALWLNRCCLCLCVWGWERPWALVGAFTRFGSCSSPDTHRSTVRSCLERFAVGLNRSSAAGTLLCFPLPCMLQGPGWRKDVQHACMVSLQ